MEEVTVVCQCWDTELGRGVWEEDDSKALDFLDAVRSPRMETDMNDDGHDDTNITLIPGSAKPSANPVFHLESLTFFFFLSGREEVKWTREYFSTRVCVNQATHVETKLGSLQKLGFIKLVPRLGNKNWENVGSNRALYPLCTNSPPSRIRVI